MVLFSTLSPPVDTLHSEQNMQHFRAENVIIHSLAQLLAGLRFCAILMEVESAASGGNA